jgi:5-methylcytosine-specific restriction endonuclease McrA
MECNWDLLSYQSKRKRVIIEQDGKCNNCGIDKWQGYLLTLELEHKNANNKDNSRDNLEALCPNCHSLTPSWRGKKNKGVVSASREMIQRHTEIWKM